MMNDQRRTRYVERALVSVRLSGHQPSDKLMELTEQYRIRAISADEQVELLKVTTCHELTSRRPNSPGYLCVERY